MKQKGSVADKLRPKLQEDWWNGYAVGKLSWHWSAGIIQKTSEIVQIRPMHISACNLGFKSGRCDSRNAVVWIFAGAYGLGSLCFDNRDL